MNSMGNTIDLGFIITKAPLESSLTFSFLTLAKNVIDKGRSTSLFLLSDGVWLVKNNQKNTVIDLLRTLIDSGIGITVSRDHLEAAGMKETDILPGVMITNQLYADLVDFVMEQCQRVMIL